MSQRPELTHRPPWSRVLVLALGVTAVLMQPGLGSAQQAPPAYSASAAADGVRMTGTFSGAPVTDTPIDFGMPTATVTSDSLGTGEAYAAMPDPGSLVLTAPGLIAGLLAQGGSGGLPPIELPPIPPYPLSVHAVRGLSPEQSAGQPPYTLTARAGDSEVEATATGGLSLSENGLLSGISSRTIISEATTGSVVVEASSELSGITVGPLALGQVTSIARMTLDPGGTVSKEQQLRIDGARIGSVPIGITDDQVALAGVPVPVPISTALQPLLTAAGITLELLPAEEFPDRVIAPAVRITMPLDGSALGAEDGTLAMTFGASTAYLTTTAPIQPVDPAPSTPSAPATTPSATPAASPPATDSFPSSDSGPGHTAATSPAANASGTAPDAAEAVSSSGVLGLFDLQALYLITAACATGAWGIGHITRILGVRRAWTSSAG